MPSESVNDISDEALAALVQRGDEHAFTALMNRYQAAMTRYGRKFLKRDEQVDDAVQDIFISVYRNINSFDTTRRFSPWIYRIAHNAFMDVIRERERDPIVLLDLDAMVAFPSPEPERDVIEEERMRQMVEDGVASLSPRYREIVILYYMQELGYQDIADVLHIPVGTVGVRLRRAREALKKTLAETQPEYLSF